MRVKCMVCRTHWAVHAGDYRGQTNVELYQCTNPDCNDENGNPNHIGQKYDLSLSVPTRIVLSDTPGMRNGLNRQYRFWEPDYKRPAPQKWSKPMPGDFDFDDDNPDGLYWSGA